jgi:hypothetical protein
MLGNKLASFSGGMKLNPRFADDSEKKCALASRSAPVAVPDDVCVDAPIDVKSEQLTLRDPRAVLSLLEADQVVAAKRRTHFGRKNLSLRTNALLWGLRVYVVAMLVIVLISVYQVIHAAR